MSVARFIDGADRSPIPDIVFSLIDGYVWASWIGSSARVRLGEYHDVTAMMEDFLAQSELAARLTDPRWTDSGVQDDVPA